MVKKRSEMMGLTVVDELGQRIGRVGDVCLDVGAQEPELLSQSGQAQTNSVPVGTNPAQILCAMGIRVDTNALFRPRKWIPLRDVRLIGAHSIIVRRYPHSVRLQSSIYPGQRVLSTSGGRLGRLADALIDETNGRVLSLEVSVGYVDDIRQGRQWVQRFTFDRPTGSVIAIPQDADGR